MKRLRMINDNVLGTLLRVGFGFQKKINGVVQFTFNKNQVAQIEQLDYILLQKIGLLEAKTVLSPRTIAEGNYHKNLLIQKSQAALIGSMSHGGIEGIRSLRKQAEELELFLKHLERKYGVFDKSIDYKDSVKISKDFSHLNDTFYFCLTFNPKQIASLKSHLKRYWLQYVNRDLDGQEKLALPNLYAAPIVVKFNNTNYINTYGKRRLSIGQDNLPYFCHSIFYLTQKGFIKLNNLEYLNSKYSATIDYLMPETTSVSSNPVQNQPQAGQTDPLKQRYNQLINEIKSHSKESAQVAQLTTEKSKILDNAPVDDPSSQIQKAVTLDSMIKWQEDFEWQGDKFVFGSYGDIQFSSRDRKTLFKMLTDAKGGWVTVQKMQKETDKNGNFIRSTLGQIEKQLSPELRKYISIPSTQNDELEPKPSQGAYRIKFTAKPQ